MRASQLLSLSVPSSLPLPCCRDAEGVMHSHVNIHTGVYMCLWTWWSSISTRVQLTVLCMLGCTTSPTPSWNPTHPEPHPIPDGRLESVMTEHARMTMCRVRCGHRCDAHKHHMFCCKLQCLLSQGTCLHHLWLIVFLPMWLCMQNTSLSDDRC